MMRPAPSAIICAHDVFGENDRRQHVELHQRLDLGIVHGREQAVGADAGIVDEAVDRRRIRRAEPSRRPGSRRSRRGRRRGNAGAAPSLIRRSRRSARRSRGAPPRSRCSRPRPAARAMARPRPRLPPVTRTLCIGARQLSGRRDVERRDEADHGRHLVGRELRAAIVQDLVADLLRAAPDRCRRRGSRRRRRWRR